jgi:hypothetical protein
MTSPNAPGVEKSAKPAFSTRSDSIKSILKVLFLPIWSPKGRGCFGYLLWPVILIAKLYVLFGIIVTFILGFSYPGAFIGTLVLFLWFSPAILAITALNGKVIHSSSKQPELKNQITQKMRALKAEELTDAGSGSIRYFALTGVSNDTPPILAIEIVAQKDSDCATYARIFMADVFSEAVASSKTGGAIQEVFHESSSGGSLGILIFTWFLKLFVADHAGKVSKIIKQLASELGSGNMGFPSTSDVSASKATQTNMDSMTTLEQTTREATSSAGISEELLDDEIMELFIKYENEPVSMADKSMRITFTFPEATERGQKVEFYNTFAAVAEEGTIPACVDKCLKLVKKDGGFSIMHEPTNTEYYQIKSGGIVLISVTSSDEASDTAEALRDEHAELKLVLNFLGLEEDERRNRQTFLAIGEEILQSFEDVGLRGAEIHVYEFLDGEPVHIESGKIAPATAVTLQKQNASVSGLSQQLSVALAELGELLRENDIDFSVQGNDIAVVTYRADEVTPYLSIETTQLFNNAGCAMTYLQKNWRAHPFAPGDLGSIDISITDSYEQIRISSLLPHEPIADEEDREEVRRKIAASIAQGQGLMRDIECNEFLFVPYMMLPLEINDPSSMTAEQVFGFIQLFALEIHRVFGNIITPSGEGVKPPKSTVQYTPDVQDASGGYFVYGPNNHIWWLIDSNFKFQSVVGAGVWQEFKDAEAGGLPLTATDMNNLYHYKEGTVYDSKGSPVGRYYPKRLMEH